MIGGNSTNNIQQEDQYDLKEPVPERIASQRPQVLETLTSKKSEILDNDEKGAMKPFKIRTYGNQLPAIPEKKLTPNKGAIAGMKPATSTHLQLQKASSGIFKEYNEQSSSKLVSLANRNSARGQRSHSTVSPGLIR